MFEQTSDCSQERKRRSIKSRVRLGLPGAILIVVLAAACAGRATVEPRSKSTPAEFLPATRPPPSATPSSTPLPTHTLSPTDTLIPADTVTPNPTPTPLPSPTHIPTPTPLLDARLRLGITLQNQGNYSAAIEQFLSFLADPAAEPSKAADARYRLGLCYSLNGEHSAAAEAFQDFLNAHPADSRRAAAHFQLAQIHVLQAEWEVAIAGYQAYLAERDTVGSTVHNLIGDAYIQLGQDEPALKSYQAALESEPYLDHAFALRAKIAEIHTRRQEYDLAIDQYEQILKAAQTNTYRAQIEYLLGHVYLLTDEIETAWQHWREAVNNYPRAHHAYLSLVELVNAGAEVDEFQRGLVDFYAGVYGAAAQAFYRYLESDVTERRDEARYYIGRAYYLSGNYALAIDEYETIMAAYPASSVALDSWLEKARSLTAQGHPDKAIETLEAFVETHPESELAPEALWRAAQLLADSAMWAEAIDFYDRLHQDYPANKRAAESLFCAGLGHYRLGEYTAAVKDWQALVSDYSASERLSAAQYWLSKAYAALGDDIQVNKWLARAAENTALLPDYYTLRASHRLESLAKDMSASSAESIESWPPTQPNLLLELNDTSAQAEAQAWLLAWADPSAEMDDLDSLTDGLAQAPHYRRGAEYLAIGLRQEASTEFEIMRVAQQDDPVAIYGLALATRELGLYQISIRCALRLVQLAPVSSIKNLPVFIQRLLYPTYFDDLVLVEAAANNLDPLLVFSLIRQESLFEPGARSYAQAIGLMQIVPSTGEWIALRLRWDDFAPTQLTRPYLNIHFGSWFLAQGFNSFGGDAFAALAAYNAGMSAPGKWLDASGGDPDLFVETIEYSQTLQYVQLIYQHHALYSHIYHSDT